SIASIVSIAFIISSRFKHLHLSMHETRVSKSSTHGMDESGRPQAEFRQTRYKGRFVLSYPGFGERR
ncbi:MAG TPA: hypothetical protein VN019_01965, partial [Oxalicibacterium sp.]|nr:hypothetical protein [Oxalicibacterium sp.]